MSAGEGDVAYEEDRLLQVITDALDSILDAGQSWDSPLLAARVAECLEDHATITWHAGTDEDSDAYSGIREIGASENGDALYAQNRRGVLPPVEWWRDAPCGHPKDPVAWLLPDGKYVCHCGTFLAGEDGVGEHPQGDIVSCWGCGCYVLVLHADDEPEATTVKLEVWTPGDQSLEPVTCPVCGSIGTARYMPEHLIEAHREERA